MSGRGGKRRQVLQLGAASKLHRYGYSKEFQSRDKKGKSSALNLVGEYSDTNSEDDSETEEQVDASNQDEGAETSPVHETTVADNLYAVPSPSPFPEGTNGSTTQDKPSDMDDELKNFLSEIEAIPMPTALDDNEQPKTSEPEAAVDELAVTVADTRKPSMYSMFVKGESEFVHSPKQAADGEDKVNSEINEEQIPEEPLTSWQVVQDENTQYVYYWNIVTNEVTWEIPLEYTQYLLLHKEYEEKMAKLSPKQLQEIKERKAKMEGKDPCLDKPNKDVASIPSAHELKIESQSLASLSFPSTSVDRQDEKDQKVPVDAEKNSGKQGDVLSNERVSPHGEASHDSRHHKQKKEKKNHHHHKRKHKHRHENSHSDEDKPSPKARVIGPLLVSTQPSSAVVVGQKLLSIVPYLSDQDENEDDDNLDAMPVLGPALPAKESNIREHKQEESAARDTAELSSSEMSEIVNDQKTSDFKLASESVDFIKILLLPPPLPPPLPEEEEPTTGQEQVPEDSSVNRKDNTEETTTNDSQPNITSQTTPERHSPDTVENNSPAHAVIDDNGDITRSIGDPATVTQVELLSDSDEVIKQTSIVGINHSDAPETKKEQPKEFIDMFADNFPLPTASQADEENVTVSPEDHLREVLQKANPPEEEIMEEGEIQDTLEEKIILQENSTNDSVVDNQKTVSVVDNQKTVSVADNQATVSVADNQKTVSVADNQKTISVVDNQKTVPKCLNIVGYASDDEEEEVEPQEKAQKRVKSSSSKQKKKDRKKDSKKRKKEKDSNLSNSAYKSREQKAAVKDSVIAQKVIPDGITPDVSEVIVKDSKKLENDDVDIDFEDFDDIDRALEVALEKKMEKNKVQQKHRVDDKEMKSAEEIIHSLGSGEEPSIKHSSSTEVAQDDNSIKVETKDDTMTKLEGETSTSKQNDIVANIEEMAELALNKLEFLDISTDNLSRLQILFIELQTRRTDWKSGGLSTQYYHKQLQIAQDLLEQYELSAVPEGWVCQWDRYSSSVQAMSLPQK